MSNLAGSYYTVARYEDAARVFAETLEKQRAALPADHRDTLFTMNNLAGTYQALNRNAEALPLFEKVLEWRQAKLPPGHPHTIQSMSNLATCYFALDRHPEALKLREATLDLCREKLPPGDPNTLISMANLAFSYQESRRHPEALKLREEVLARHKIEHGLDHPETLRSMGEVAASLIKVGRGAESVPIIDDVVRRAAGLIVYPNLIPDVMDVRLRHFEQVQDANGCRETAELWEKLNRSDGLSLYDAARFRAVAAAVIRATDRSSNAPRRVDAEADRAMAWLRQAVAAGVRDLAVLTRDKDIDVLRDRPDFEKLMADLHPHTGP
jgi:tetratricopeptide (TPR) repeat protein